MRKKQLLLATGALLLSATTLAEAAAITALVGGRLIDGFGGTPIDHSVILIEGERIKAVGTEDSLPIPAGSTVISTGGMSVLPGLWDAHVHTGILGHTSPGYPDDILAQIADRTAKGNQPPLFWTPTISVLYNYEYLRDNAMQLDDPGWQLERRSPSAVPRMRATLAAPPRHSP